MVRKEEMFIQEEFTQEELSRFLNSSEDSQESLKKRLLEQYTAFLTSKLEFEYSYAAHGTWRVSFEAGHTEDSDQVLSKPLIIHEPGDGKVSLLEETAIRSTTGMRLGCNDSLGDYQHFLITRKSFPSNAPEAILAMERTRTSPLLAYPLFFSTCINAVYRGMTEGEGGFTPDASRMLVELLPLFNLDAEEGKEFMNVINNISIKEGSELGNIDGSWQWDYDRLEHRIPLFPAVFASRSDGVADPCELGLYAGVLQRYANVPAQPVEQLLEQDNTLRNAYRERLNGIFTNFNYSKILLDPTREKIVPLINRDQESTLPSLNELAVNNVYEAMKDAHKYVHAVKSLGATKKEINDELIPLFVASNRLWRGLFDDGGVISRRTKAMIPYILESTES